MSNILKAIYPPLLIATFFLAMSCFHLIFLFGYFVMVLDISARSKEYTYLTRTGDVRYAKRKMRASWCGRTAAVAAIPEMREWYYQKGYRWWHILPEGFPLVFLKPAFWKTVIGIK